MQFTTLLLLQAILVASIAMQSVAHAEVALPFVSQNAAARHYRRSPEEQGEVQARNAHAHAHRRSVSLDGGRKFHAIRRRTPTTDQEVAQAKLNAFTAKLANTNTAWQAAAMASLKEGKTPQTWDEFAAAGHSTGSSDGNVKTSVSHTKEVSKKQTKPAQLTSETDDEGDDGDDDDEDDGGDDDDDQEDISPESTKPASTKQTTKPASTKPKSTPAPPKSTPEPSKPKSSGGGILSGAASSVFDGEVTFYAPGLGACGKTNSETDLIAAITASDYDAQGLSNSSKVCGRKARVTYNGNSVDVTIVDRCAGCSATSLDLSPAAFRKLADEGVGRLHGVKWTYLS